MEDDLKNTISDVLNTVLKNKYIVKIYDKIAEKYDTYEWNVSELITYLTANNIVEIHLFQTINLSDFSLTEGEK